MDENNDYADHLLLRRNDTGSQLSAYYQDLPSFPCDITVKVRAATHGANFARGGGIILLPSSPSTSVSARYLGFVYEGGRNASWIFYNGNLSTFGGQASIGAVATPNGLWLRVTILSGGTNADVYYSTDGVLWTTHLLNTSIGITAANAGIALAPEGQAADLTSLFSHYRVSA